MKLQLSYDSLRNYLVAAISVFFCWFVWIISVTIFFWRISAAWQNTICTAHFLSLQIQICYLLKATLAYTVAHRCTHTQVSIQPISLWVQIVASCGCNYSLFKTFLVTGSYKDCGLLWSGCMRRWRKSMSANWRVVDHYCTQSLQSYYSVWT